MITTIAQWAYGRVVAGAGDVIPQVDPGQGGDAPGLSGIGKLINNLAVYGLYAGLASIILGAMMAGLGPRIGFTHAKQIGMGGILGGAAVAAVIALARTFVVSGYDWFTTA